MAVHRGPNSQKESKWGPALAAITAGKTIHVPGYQSGTVVPSLTRSWQKEQGLVLRSRGHRSGGSVVWLEKR